MHRPQHAVIVLCFLTVWLGLISCGSGPAAEKPSTANDAHSTAEVSSQSTTGREQTVSPGDRTITKGLITEVQRTSTGKWILVEADPQADCRSTRSLRNNPGCDKMYYEVLEKPARILRDEGCDGKDVVEASADDLQVGQRVRAWTGEPYATSNPGQARAWEVVICAGAREDATAASLPPSGAEERIAFLSQQGRPIGGLCIVPGAAFTGTLVVDKQGCLRLKPGDLRGHLPVWPPGHSLGTEGGKLLILDDRGRVVAQTRWTPARRFLAVFS